VQIQPNESERVLQLAGRLLLIQQNSAHFQAVQAQCAFSIEAFRGVLEVVESQNGIAAQSLLRTLFEAVVSAVILAKHPEKLDDFMNHGKLTTFRMARAIPSNSPLASAVSAFRDATKAECDTLYAYFKETGNWHLLKNADAFAEAGLPNNMRGRYYLRASAIAHGHPFPVVQHFGIENKGWKIRARHEDWQKWIETARVMGMLLMLHMIEQLNSLFQLGMDSAVALVKQDVEGIAHQQMKAGLPSVK
jgi:hypothetical protein